MASVGAFIGILTAVTPGVLWVKGYFQTAEDAKAIELRNARRDAWSSYGIARIESVMLRNRVNECDEKTAARSLRPIEVASCEQYRREFAEVAQRLRELQKEAIALGKEK